MATLEALGCTLRGTLADEEVNPTFAENICVVQVLHFLLLDREVTALFLLLILQIG